MMNCIIKSRLFCCFECCRPFCISICVVQSHWFLNVILLLFPFSFVITSCTLYPQTLSSSDSQNFYELVTEGCYVDKTLMIKEYLMNVTEKYFLVTRPRRWGKSLNIEMLQAFLQIEVDKKGKPLSKQNRTNHKLFVGGKINLGNGRTTKRLKPLKIAQHKDIMQNEGKFPVISVSLLHAEGNTYKDIEYCVKNIISQLYEKHQYLMHSKLLNDDQKQIFSLYLKKKMDRKEIANSLFFLSKLFSTHFSQRVHIFVDEYDAPLNSLFAALVQEFKQMFPDASESTIFYKAYKSNEFKWSVDLFSKILHRSLKDNIHLDRALVTGILRLSIADVGSCNRFSTSYGFCQEEIDDLLIKLSLQEKGGDIKEWYGGYEFGGNILYNPWSVLKCLGEKGELDTYWSDVGNVGFINNVFLTVKAQERIQDIVSNKSIFVETTDVTHSNILGTEFITILLYNGYLTTVNVTSEAKGNHKYNVRIPNREVRQLYEKVILQWIPHKTEIEKPLFINMAEQLCKFQVESFKKTLQQALLLAASITDTGEEKGETYYNGFMTALLCSFLDDYYIESDSPSGSGRPDHIIIAKSSKFSNAIILEYKISDNKEQLKFVATDGLQQIKEKEYDARIRPYTYIKKVLKISLAFCGKYMDLDYEIDNEFCQNMAPQMEHVLNKNN